MSQVYLTLKRKLILCFGAILCPVAFLVTPFGATAEEMPEFDGVYLRMQDGSLHQLNTVEYQSEAILIRPRNDCIKLGSSVCNVMQLRANLGELRQRPEMLSRFEQNAGGWLQLNLELVQGQYRFGMPLSLVRDGNPRSIVVRGRTTEIGWINDVVLLDDVISELNKHRSADSLIIPNGVGDGAIDSSFYYVFNRWGCSVSTFNVRTVDQFTSEYFIDKCALTNRTSGSPISEKGTLSLKGAVFGVGRNVYGFLYQFQ